jgi:hypothetical protein
MGHIRQGGLDVCNITALEYHRSGCPAEMEITVQRRICELCRESEGDWTRLWQRAAALMGQPCDNQNREIHYDRFVIKIRGHL